MKEKVVFEYSRLEKKFNGDNPNNRKNFELIYDKGVENVEISALNIDNNEVNERYSKEMEYFFKLLEINKGSFIKYCMILEHGGEVSVVIPEDNKILNNQKLLKRYWDREAFIQVCPKLLQKLVEENKPFTQDAKKLYARHEYRPCVIPIWIQKDFFDNFLKTCQFVSSEKIYSIGEDLINFPHEIIFERFVPYFCIGLASEEKMQQNEAELDEYFKFYNYVIVSKKES